MKDAALEKKVLNRHLYAQDSGGCTLDLTSNDLCLWPSSACQLSRRRIAPGPWLYGGHAHNLRQGGNLAEELHLRCWIKCEVSVSTKMGCSVSDAVSCGIKSMWEAARPQGVPAPLVQPFVDAISDQAVRQALGDSMSVNDGEDR